MRFGVGTAVSPFSRRVTNLKYNEKIDDDFIVMPVCVLLLADEYGC